MKDYLHSVSKKTLHRHSERSEESPHTELQSILRLLRPSQ